MTLGPAVPNPGKIVCVGLNYRKHAEETGAAIPDVAGALLEVPRTRSPAPDEDVPLTDAATQYDYEVELAVVMGETTKNVSAGRCPEHGLRLRDGKRPQRARLAEPDQPVDSRQDDGQVHAHRTVPGDRRRGAGSRRSSRIRTWLNGELRQNSNTDDMIFPVAEIIAYISRHFTLEPGDVIITGTPEGVILGMAEKRWMVPGDVVEVEVEGLGKLRNRMVAG